MPQPDLPDWNDLRDILLVAETGSLSAAARRLGVSQSTMSRRMAAVEAGGRPVFRRSEAGQLEPTARGEVLLRAARAMQAAAREAEIELTAKPAPIRIAACEVTARLFVSDAVAAWSERSVVPAELAVYENLFDLPAAAYDLLVCPVDAPPEGRAGSRIGSIEMGIYAAVSYLDRYPLPPGVTDLTGHRVIRASGSLALVPAYRRFAELGGTVALLSSSPLAQLDACARGQGVALLPTRLAEADERLQALDLSFSSAGEVWIMADATEASHPRLAGFLRWARRHFGAGTKGAEPPEPALIGTCGASAGQLERKAAADDGLLHPRTARTIA
ncbi:hypothetical protein Rumeso_02233 [Rubellimicrobium mesophilum DSM 19309]|uniref:HTH lysR-type domain-containing protein n=1 Tax=Rubellimicrobium mesophilum DSM 19309 TaxID=442562 RepID=A0A017HPT4_9RHOB|nr:LysR family transcriptional regulator [Rubellimicrobium mesophilum]EYD76158.1 hypothetical protein Rumeso_02233 [Rubellimicrobium mesophilum DSM 19309]